jgi:chromosome segregation ATPase
MTAGKSATHSAIQKATRKFNIQIDNLCQFLPQDRVSEFAELPNTEKLVQTVRAAAPPEMLEYHKSLIELGKQVDGDRDVLDNDKTQLKQLEARQAVLQQDVDRLRERQEVIAKIELLEKMKPYIKYRESRVQWLNKKQQHKDAVKELHELEAEMKPAMERPQNKGKYRAAVKAVLGIRSEELKTKETEINRHKTNVIEKCEKNINSIKADINAAQRTEAKRKDEIRSFKKKVDDIKKKIEAGPPEFDLAYYQGREVRNSKVPLHMRSC